LLLLSIENCPGRRRPLARHAPMAAPWSCRIPTNARTPEPMIAMVDVHKWTGDLHVLKGVSLTVRS